MRSSSQYFRPVLPGRPKILLVGPMDGFIRDILNDKKYQSDHGPVLYHTKFPQDLEDYLKNGMHAIVFAVGEGGLDEASFFEIRRTLPEEDFPPLFFTLGGGYSRKDALSKFECYDHIISPEEFDEVVLSSKAAAFYYLWYQKKDLDSAAIRLVNELSENFLKVTNYDQLIHTLSEYMPKVLKSSFILLSMPMREHPVVYFHSSGPLSPDFMKAFRAHLSSAWANISDEEKPDWVWLDSLPTSNSNELETIEYHSSDFVSAPISHGDVKYGFLSYYSSAENPLDIMKLQAHLTTAGLLSVVIHSLELVRELNLKATHDGLTQILNRQTVMERLSEEVSSASRYDYKVSLIMFDLDHFKKINDTYGHQAGDAVLIEVSKRLKAALRHQDYAGRAGGEEFVAVLPHTESRGARIWAERFRELIASEPVTFQDLKIPVTASFGVSTTDGADDPDKLIALADEALYRSKNDGRNRVTMSMEASGVVEKQP